MSPRIRVDPSILRQSSKNVSSVGTNLSQVGQSALGKASGAPSYDGQFGPRLQAIGYEALSRAQGLSSRMNTCSGQLQSRAQAFEAADMASISGFYPLPVLGSETQKNSIIDLSRLAGMPKSKIITYLFLGTLLNPIIGPSILIGAFILKEYERKTFIGQSDLRGFLSGKIDLKEFGKRKILIGEKRGRPPKPKNELKLKIPVWEDRWKGDDVKGNTKIGGVRLGGKGEYEFIKGEAGFGVGLSGGRKFAGAYAGVTGLEGAASGVIGSTDLGIGGELRGKALSGEAFVGYREGRVGAKIGGTVVSAEGTIGANVAGVNVGVTGEIGIKFELGLEIGKKSKVFLGPFTIGLNIGEALGS